MKVRYIAIHYLLITLLAIPATIRADPDTVEDGWAVLQSLPPGEKVSVKLANGKKISGSYLSVSEDGLVLSMGKENASYSRQDVIEVRLGHGRSLKKPIMVGALVGAGAGAGLGGAVAAGDNSEFFDIKAQQGIPVGAAVGAVFGTAVGAVVGLFRGRGELIYSAPR